MSAALMSVKLSRKVRQVHLMWQLVNVQAKLALRGPRILRKLFHVM